MEYVSSLMRRWSFWHTAMIMIATCFFFESFILLGDVYWWKLLPKPKSLEGLIPDSDYDLARQSILVVTSGEFAGHLLKYGWYVLLLGYGWLEWAWIKFTSLPRFKNRLFKNDLSYDALVGCMFLGLFLLVEGSIIATIIYFLKRLARGDTGFETPSILGTLWSGLNVGFLALFFCYLGCLWELRFGLKLFLAAPFLQLILSLSLDILGNTMTRAVNTPIAQMPAFPAKEAILALCEQVGFNRNNIYMNNSDVKNAYASGFGPFSTIVLFGGLRDLKTSELLGITAHELGHWTYKHIPLKFLENFVWTCISVGLFYLFRQRFWFKSVLGKDSPVKKPQDFPLPLSVIIFFITISPFKKFFGDSISNMLSWLCEMAADRFAMGHGYGEDLISALLNLSKGAYHYSIRSPIYGLFYLTHPPYNVRFNYIRGGGIFQ